MTNSTIEFKTKSQKAELFRRVFNAFGIKYNETRGISSDDVHFYFANKKGMKEKINSLIALGEEKKMISLHNEKAFMLARSLGGGIDVLNKAWQTNRLNDNVSTEVNVLKNTPFVHDKHLQKKIDAAWEELLEVRLPKEHSIVFDFSK